MCLVSSGLNLNRKGGPNSDTLWDMDMGWRGGGSMEDIARDGGCTSTLRDEFPPRDRMLRVPVS